MSLQEERMQILKMLEDGKISAGDAAKLLAALDTGAKKEEKGVRVSGAGAQTARWLRIRVTDERSGKQKVSVNVPMGLVSVAMKMGAKFAPEMSDINMEEIVEAIQSGAQGKIVDVQDDEGGERVEIFVE